MEAELIMVDDNAVDEEAEVEYVFTAYEIDLDYEFNAARFFDFTREESPLEVQQAEAWFDSAGSHPPSPYVMRLVPREETLIENSKISSHSKGTGNINLFESDYDGEVDDGISAVAMHCGDEDCKVSSSNASIGMTQNIQNHSQKLIPGSVSYNHFVNNVNSEKRSKQSMKPAFPRTSTLMKPTASHLAKQHHHPGKAGDSMSHTSVLDKTSTTSTSSCLSENQAAKRQKLEGGLLRKVMDTMQQQEINFVHKVVKQDKIHYGNNSPAKPKITIPRDPDLETARRAQRAMEKNSKVEKATSTVYRFKARPLNRKILETPPLLPKRSTTHAPDFQEFHLKTSERAAQHSSLFAVPSNNSSQELHKCSTGLTKECGRREPGSIRNTASRPDGCQSSHSFKAPSLHKKELNFRREKRYANPPVELFTKLSLAPETQPAASLETKDHNRHWHTGKKIK